MKPFPLFTLAFSLMLLAGCEPQGPTANVEDHIDEVMNTAPDAAPALPTRTHPEPEVMEQQKKRHQQVVEQASQEARNKLEQILENS